MNEETKLIIIESDYERALAEREAIEAELKKLTDIIRALISDQD